RAIKDLARELVRDPVELRRANLVHSSATPYRLPTGLSLDSGDYAATLNAALALAGYPELRQQQAELRKQGRYLGIGLAAFAENSGVGPSMAMDAVGFRRAGHESARVVVHPDARATVFCGTQSTGQGHATGFAQIARPVYLELLSRMSPSSRATARRSRSGQAPSTRAPRRSAARPYTKRPVRSWTRPRRSQRTSCSGAPAI